TMYTFHLTLSLRSSPLLRGSTLCGSAVPSWPPFPPSSRCGSVSRSTTRLDPPLSTASASKEPAPFSRSMCFAASPLFPASALSLF
ncbi:hypothetical protein GOODEAATRI_015435, partial [Goodea atripinnis]